MSLALLPEIRTLVCWTAVLAMFAAEQTTVLLCIFWSTGKRRLEIVVNVPVTSSFIVRELTESILNGLPDSSLQLILAAGFPPADSHSNSPVSPSLTLTMPFSPPLSR